MRPVPFVCVPEAIVPFGHRSRLGAISGGSAVLLRTLGDGAISLDLIHRDEPVASNLHSRQLAAVNLSSKRVVSDTKSSARFTQAD